MWSNYTDPECKRLIWSTYDMRTQGRYLLKCDAVDCCVESQDSDQDEFQIPNVHPASLAQVSHNKTTVRIFDQDIFADAWSWKFGPEHYTAYTVPCTAATNCGPLTNVSLVGWYVRAFTEEVLIQFRNFTTPTNVQAFKNTFYIPEECKPNPLKCDDAVDRGLLRPERLAKHASGASQRMREFRQRWQKIERERL
jgi:hypothetical protein